MCALAATRPDAQNREIAASLLARLRFAVGALLAVQCDDLLAFNG